MKTCFEFPNKVRYNTKRDAETAILLSDKPNHLKVYKCETCSGWHLSSNVF